MPTQKGQSFRIVATKIDFKNLVLQHTPDLASIGVKDNHDGLWDHLNMDEAASTRERLARSNPGYSFKIEME